MNRSRRTGFTLIELLVVISLIAVLVALSAGAFFRIRNGQTRSTNDATLNKLNNALDNRWKAIRDSVDNDAKNGLGQYPNALRDANGDPDVARTLLLYAKMKNELPMTFNEARNPTVLGSIVLQARAHFTTPFAGLTSTGSPEESAACFYAAVTSSSGGGAVAEGGLEQQTKSVSFGAVTLPVYTDAWGTSIAFVRQAYCQEVQAAPFIRNAPRDPFDTSPTSKATGALNAKWPSIIANTPAFAGMPAAYNPSLNFVPTLISAGSNKSWGADIYGDDNQLSFRLRREGNKGD